MTTPSAAYNLCGRWGVTSSVDAILGRAQFPVELPDLDTAVIDRIWQRIQERFKQIDQEENVETSCTPLDDVEHAAAAPAVKSAIYAAAKSLGLATMDLPSGAVQDAQRSPPWA